MLTRKIQRNVKTVELALSASMAAIYIVSTLFPVSPFIGGPGFITLEIVMLPVIAALLRPALAGVSITVGSIGMALLRTSIYGFFGPLGLLVPIVATVLGSVGFHYRFGLFVPWAYVLAGAVFYLAFSQGTVLWLIPYLAVIVSPIVVLRLSGLLKMGFLSLYTAMSEQVGLNVLSISVLGLVGAVWTGITPFMFSERTLATVGGAILIVALKSRLGSRLENSLDLERR